MSTAVKNNLSLANISFIQKLNHKRLNENKKALRLLKMGIWLYIFFLIFEGALRKWFLPFLATPLLIVRDPIVVWTVLYAWNRKLLPINVFVVTAIIIGITGIFTSIFFGHGSLPVALYGARIFLFHFPLMFVMGKVFAPEDVIRIGKIILWLSLPFTILVALQFFSPQSAWVNRGVGGDESGAGFSGALGFARPPGVFSFTNGNTAFYGLVANFLFFFWIQPKHVSKILVISTTIALIVAIPFSISRGLLFNVLVALAFTLFAVLLKAKNKGGILIGLAGVALVFAILSQTHFFQTSTAAFSARFENANEAEGGLKGVLIDRYFGGLISALTNSSQIPYFGYGIGMGTNVGSMLLSGKQQFLIAEGEWGRLVGELGFLLGLIVIILRVMLGGTLLVNAYKKLLADDFLPWGLISYGLLVIPQGTWSQPTSLGFGILIGGLIMASLNTKTSNK